MLLIKEFPSYTLIGLLLGSMYVFLALGYTLVYRVLKLIDLSYSATLAVGIFFAVALQTWWTPQPKGIWSILVFCLATVALLLVVCIAIRTLLQWGMFSPMRRRGASNLVVVIASLGIYYVLQEACGLWQGQDLLSYTLPFANILLFSVGGAQFKLVDALLIGTSLATALAIGIWLHTSRFGKSVTAVAQDPIAAQLNGISVNFVATIIFGITGLLAACGSVLYVFFYTDASYDVGLVLAINGLIAALLGGMGSVSGAVIGSFLFGLIESYGAALFGSTWQDIIGYIALVILLLVSPSGMIRERRQLTRA